MFKWPVVAETLVPSMSTTCLPSTSPSVLNVGPGPSDTYGTVTRPSSTPNATTGASATNSVTTRLFTRPTVRVCAANPFTDSVTLRPRRPRPMSTVDGMADLPFGFSAGDDPARDQPRKTPRPGDSGDSGDSGDQPGFDVADLGKLFTQLGQMFSGAGVAMSSGKASGPVNYDLARQLASKSIGFVRQIPDTTSSAISDAVHLAETWLDGVTALPAGTSKAVGWTPQDWIDSTLDTWKRLCDPWAEQISTVWASALPEDAKAMAGPLLSMMSQMGGMAFGSQLGQALATLSKEVLTSTDVGLPLGPKGVAALMPDAIEELSKGLENPRSAILTFLAAREAAHHRLFSPVPWLARHPL